MRRWTALLLCVLLCAALAACGGEDAAPETPATTTLPVLTQAPTTSAAPITEPVTEPVTTEETEPVPTTEPPLTEEELERLKFYHVFWELDPDETDAWLAAHPEYFEDGYEGISVNEAWLEDEGLELYTTQGHQVLAIDAKERILIVRFYTGGSRGVLAIAKDPARLHLYPSSRLGAVGEKVGTIASNHNGLLAMTGSGFDDPNFAGNGGTIAGMCYTGGKTYGKPMGYNYFRLELSEDNWLSISRAQGAVRSDTTDAMEFEPSLLVDGQLQSGGIWTGENPRACLGQNRRGEILMLGLEGRFDDSPGASVVNCAEIMLMYEGLTAMNMDGGTTAILWYRGQPIMRCSNKNTPDGRYLPNAWVYVKSEE